MSWKVDLNIENQRIDKQTPSHSAFPLHTSHSIGSTQLLLGSVTSYWLVRSHGGRVGSGLKKNPCPMCDFPKRFLGL